MCIYWLYIFIIHLLMNELCKYITYMYINTNNYTNQSFISILDWLIPISIEYEFILSLLSKPESQYELLFSAHFYKI